MFLRLCLIQVFVSNSASAVVFFETQSKTKSSSFANFTDYIYTTTLSSTNCLTMARPSPVPP
jgi:hypothetical protein